MKLYVNEIEAVKGQEVKTFRGEKAILKSWLEPQHLSSSGHVYIEIDGTVHEYYPSVIKAKFKECI